MWVDVNAGAVGYAGGPQDEDVRVQFRGEMTAIRVEVLFAPECASAGPARDAIERVACAAGVDIEVVSMPVADGAEARRLRFPGSPTVRVAGQDVEPRAAALEQYGLG